MIAGVWEANAQTTVFVNYVLNQWLQTTVIIVITMVVLIMANVNFAQIQLPQNTMIIVIPMLV
jgi:hypothetical protein